MVRRIAQRETDPVALRYTGVSQTSRVETGEARNTGIVERFLVANDCRFLRPRNRMTQNYGRKIHTWTNVSCEGTQP